MFKVKSVFDKDLTYKEKSARIGKASLVKKVIVAAMLTVASIAVCDVAILSSDVVKVNTIANYKVNHYKSLSSYSTFKSQIDAVPYTDAQFNKDLKALDAIYNHQGNVMYNKVMTDVSEGYGSFLSMVVLGDGRYIDQTATYNKVLSLTKNMPEKELKDVNPKIYGELAADKAAQKDKMKWAMNWLASLRMTSRYATFGEGIDLNKGLYENMERYFKEKGFGENILFISPELALSRGDRGQDIQIFNNKLRESTQKANSELESVYRSGDKAKLKELLQMAYAFKYRIAGEIAQKTYSVGSIETPLSFQLMGDAENGYGLAKSMRWIAQKNGDYTPENALYYDDDFFFSLYY
jgi:hypothetical protein